MKKRIILLTVLLVCFLTATAYASSYTVAISAKSSTSVNLGETVNVTVSLKNIDGEGIGAIVGKIEYDQNIFEKVTSADVKACSGWNSIAYNDIDGNAMQGSFTTERASGDIIKTDNEIMEITLKVKKDATLGSTIVKITRN